ncbi:MAG: nucleotidyltransferase family protein [Dehalococcoidia bacterium]|nr:nucleotidyltransferase family protein [Dehalococcoidia bacterium]
MVYALTIAGGRGERLKPLTDDLPKPMVPINGRPLISYQTDWLVREGVTDIVFLCGWKAEKIRGYFGDGLRFGFHAHYSLEETPLGRGGAVRKGMGLVPKSEEQVIVLNGDNITNQSLAMMIALQLRKRAMATAMLVPYPSQYGVVQAGEDYLVTEFIEKGRLPFWINAGVYVFDRSIETLLPEIGDHETSTFPQLVKERRMAALKSEAVWLTVDSPKDVREVGDKLQSGVLAKAVL